MSKLKKILNIIFDTQKTKLDSIAVNYKNEKKTVHILKTKDILKPEDKYLTATELSKHFKITASQLNNVFSQLSWANKEDRWWIMTSLGEANGAKQCYDNKNKVKYVRWKESTKRNTKLIHAIESSRIVKNKSNKQKGEEYEKFIANYYKGLGYFVWEHGKEKGRLDQGIDLIVKKNKEIIFIQCKNWKENTRFKIDHVRIKASRAEARQFMLDNPLFKGYDNKFRYTLSNDCMHLSAIKYIEETNGLFDYEVIKMEQ